MVKAPTIRPETGPEHHKAKWWRMHCANLTIDRLAELTGYSKRAIYLMELGCTAKGKKVQPWVWQRYKRACQAVHSELMHPTVPFNWGQ